MDHVGERVPKREAMTTEAETASKSALRPEWANARRIVVKIGSALLTDRATGTAEGATGSIRCSTTSRRCARGQAGPARLVRRDRPRPPHARSCRRARWSWSRARPPPPSARSAWRTPIRRCAGARGLSCGAGAADPGRYRGAPPPPQRARTPSRRCSSSRPFRSSTRTTPWRRPRSATATTTGCGARCPMVSADCLVLLSDIDGLYTAARATPNATRIDVVSEITPEIEPWPATPAPSCRRAA